MGVTKLELAVVLFALAVVGIVVWDAIGNLF